MVRRGSVKRVFPGGNTSRGFFSFYDHIAPPDGYTFVLKGGPGTGKSTFMATLARRLATDDVNVEVHHCSADAASIDAIVFSPANGQMTLPRAGVTVVDGTAPHVYEPGHYQLNGEIVDLGRCCDGDVVRQHDKHIRQAATAARGAFQRAYRYLAAARHVREDWEAANLGGRRERFLQRTIAELIDELFTEPRGRDRRPEPGRRNDRAGRQRRLFATSITPDGPRHHMDSLVGSLSRLFIVQGEPGTGRSELLVKVGEAAVMYGYDVEWFHCAFEPEQIDHIIIPGLSVGLVSSVPPHEYAPNEAPGEGTGRRTAQTGARAEQIIRHINLNDGPAGQWHGQCDTRSAVEAAKTTFEQLFRRAVDALKDAQRYHMQAESLYIPAMNFDGVEQVRTVIGERIEARLDAISSR